MTCDPAAADDRQTMWWIPAALAIRHLETSGRGMFRGRMKIDR